MFLNEASSCCDAELLETCHPLTQAEKSEGVNFCNQSPRSWTKAYGAKMSFLPVIPGLTGDSPEVIRFL